MIAVSVKPEYQGLYDGLHFEGEMKSPPRLLHGAWICEVYVGDDRAAVAFRLGHLTALANSDDEVDGLQRARAAGWAGEVAKNPLEVTLWTAREIAWGMIHIAGYVREERGGEASPIQPGARQWAVLEFNLGRPSDGLERDVFVSELNRVLAAPNLTNQWPEG